MKNKASFSKISFTVLLFSLSVAFFMTSCSKEDRSISFKATTPLTGDNDNDSCSLTTFTQGGWGSNPHGNNPGTYLLQHFAGAFPNGLTVGCSTYTLTLTSAQAVSDFLPCGGPVAALTANYTNPTTLANTLAGQLVALTLSVGFDVYDTTFAGSPLNLGNLTVVSGVFQGMTVNAILAEANKALGGCPTNFSLSDLNAILTSINENFDNGTVNNGIVKCSGVKSAS